MTKASVEPAGMPDCALLPYAVAGGQMSSTRAPSAAKRRAVAAPMPPAAPVTATTHRAKRPGTGTGAGRRSSTATWR